MHSLSSFQRSPFVFQRFIQLHLVKDVIDALLDIYQRGSVVLASQDHNNIIYLISSVFRTNQLSIGEWGVVW